MVTTIETNLRFRMAYIDFNLFLMFTLAAKLSRYPTFDIRTSPTENTFGSGPLPSAVPVTV